VNEKIPALKLYVTTSGPDAGLMRMVNTLAQPVELEYYEILSNAGSLNANGWSSIDDQEGPDPPGMGWVEGGRNDDELLSEGVIIGTPMSVAAGGEISLGSSFTPGADEDLTFFVGLPDGTLQRAAVEYVASIGLVGDYNNDHVVDAADYVMWRKLNPTQLEDYTQWVRNFGFSLDGSGGEAAATAPEPKSLLMAIAAVIAAGIARRTRAK
jgi:hypothetical protein